MKILVSHPDAPYREELVEWLERVKHHAVLYDCEGAHNWPMVLAQYEPDFVLVTPAVGSEMRFALSRFPDCQLCLMPSEVGYADADFESNIGPLLRETEHMLERGPTARPYASERRTIMIDSGYDPYSSWEKLHIPKADSDWQKRATDQRTRAIESSLPPAQRGWFRYGR